MAMRLVIMFENYGPYHLARLAAARARGHQEGITVYGLETMARSGEYQWITGKGEDRKHICTIFSEDNAPRRIGLGAFPRIWQALNRLQPDALAIPGYNDLASMTAFIWAKLHGKITVMMSESTYEDKARNHGVEYLKRQIVSRFDAALVGGRRQKEYAAFLGIPADRIFLGYDVVDNEHFARGAAEARQKEDFYRQRHGLPKNYFLNVSRFIEKKNLHFLIEAYRQYRCLAGNGAWDLVLCGSGPLGPNLQDEARDLPGIHFPGFKQADELPLYYGLAKVFIIPSSNFEQWGLVVNEAMASGLPVLVSRACGCAPDLVREGENGFTFDPFNKDELASLMVKISSDHDNLENMGTASKQIINGYTLDIFAENIIAPIVKFIEERH